MAGGGRHRRALPPADEDRYDLTGLSEVLAEVADSAAGLVDHRAFVQPSRVRDFAEYARADRVEELRAGVGPGPIRGARPARAGGHPAPGGRLGLRPQWDESSPSSAAPWSSATSSRRTVAAHESLGAGRLAY